MIRTFLILLCLPLMAAAKPATKAAAKSPAKPTAKEVDKVFAAYRAGKPMQAKVKKVVTQEIMGTTMTSTGTFYFSKGKLRMDISEPERTILVYDGKTIWSESRSGDDQILVTKIRTTELKKSDSLLASLFNREDVLKNFTLKKVKTDEGKKIFDFEAKDKKADVQELEITLKNKDIQRIAYKDQTENKVSLEFDDLSHVKLDANKFAYKPPKGAEVTEL